MDDPKSHQTVLVHPDQAAAGHLLLQEALSVEMVVVTAVSPQPLLHVHNGPGDQKKIKKYRRNPSLTTAGRTWVVGYWLHGTVGEWLPSQSFSEKKSFDL